ncbi:cytidylyltransferase domain-containing protein [Salinispira pacifica]|uniref:N-Acetylneuraminate cytidylyltransferase n=1 Tax=Salinispira pacifica TaxID=1307761 RepID=V5WKY5_9SPIO|nr:acylneuraminate cytidylyltransferase family protein [Salinispira pacifica]AHC16487.1 N-Acetylneuraminate cytidylyltransferase [Salinispira pacifica]
MSGKIVAIIPARKGSKRLPGKNALELGGKPLFMWSVDAARNSNIFDTIIVSTDDQFIINECREKNIECIERAAELASDTASSVDVVLNVLEHLDEAYSAVVLLQPTSPLRSAEDIYNAYKLFNSKSANSVVTVCEVDHPVEWTMELSDDGSLSPFVNNFLNRRSQDASVRYRLNGAVYISSIDSFIRERSFFPTEKIYASVMSRENSVDIDTELDFKLAQAIILDLPKK